MHSVATGRPVEINVKEDAEVISGKVKSFVESCNAVLQFIQNQQKLQKSKDGREHLGIMGGDGLLRTIENDFRRILQEPQRGIQGSINQLNQIGIEFNRNGTLNLNTEKFNNVLARIQKVLVTSCAGMGSIADWFPCCAEKSVI